MAAERLDTAAVFERMFSIYRRQARVLLPVAFAVLLVPALLPLAGGVATRALALAATWIAAIWYQGMVVFAVQDLEDGVRDLSVGALIRSVAPVLAPLMWTAIIVGVGVFCGLVVFIVPGLVLLTWWSVAAPVVVIERSDPMSALTRSRGLVRGNGWQVFGVLIVTVVIIFTVEFALLSLARGISGSAVAVAVAGLCGSALTAPLFALASAVLYLTLRRAPESHA